MKRWAVVGALLAAVGCGPSPNPLPTPQTCATLGWRCGVDDQGNVCGTCTGGTTCNGAGACAGGTVGTTSHTVGTGAVPLFTGFHGITFSVPASGVGYSTTSASDTYDVGIFTPDNWAIYSSGAMGSLVYAQHTGVSNAADGANLPAGNYVLGFYCRNAIERCAINYSVAANY